MEIYVSEKEPNREYTFTIKARVIKNNKIEEEFCEIKSLEQHDKELLSRFVCNILKELNTLTQHGYTDDQWENACISKYDVEDKIIQLLKERGVE